MKKVLHNSFHQCDGLLYKYKAKPYEDMGEVWKQELDEVITLVTSVLNEGGSPIEAQRAFAEYINLDYENADRVLKKGCESAVKSIMEEM